MSARVLIVDDLFPNIKLLETKLTVEYFDVVSAMNGPDALAVCEKGLCDIVLLDVMMPGMDGFEVCRRIKSTPTTAHLPVVMVTALDQPSDRLRGLDAGADDFLTKPIDDTALMARVRSLVRLKAVTDELRSRAMASRVGDPTAWRRPSASITASRPWPRRRRPWIGSRPVPTTWCW
jgi:two-component system cell cycle response regulator